MVLSLDGVVKAGTYSLRVSAHEDAGNIRVNYGGFLNTGYTVGATDEFIFSFDWIKTNNKLGGADLDYFIFTVTGNASPS